MRRRDAEVRPDRSAPAPANPTRPNLPVGHLNSYGRLPMQRFYSLFPHFQKLISISQKSGITRQFPSLHKRNTSRSGVGTLDQIKLAPLRNLEAVSSSTRCTDVMEKMMTKKTKDEILHDHNHDGIDRRGFLKCMAWAGTGALCVMQGGVLKSYSLSRMSKLAPAAAAGELSFVQVSDSHMGFNKPANPDVVGTLKAAVDKINALPAPPEFLLHTGDISHLSKPEEFDNVDQILKGTGKEVFFVPGEHDVLNDDGKQFLERYGKGSQGSGWRR